MVEENKEALFLSFLILVSLKDPDYLISSLFVNISIDRIPRPKFCLRQINFMGNP